LAVSSLAAIQRRFLWETAALLTWFDTPLPDPPGGCPPVHLSSEEMCVIRLYDSWSRFCRSLIIASAADRPATLGGVRLGRAPGISHRQDVLPTLRATFPRGKVPWWEPHWGIALDAIDAAQRLRVVNFPQISAAFGVVGSPADDLRRTRNFFAHRSEGTMAWVTNMMASYGLGATARARDLIRQLVPPGVTVFEQWVHRLRAIARTACQ
jgi:hypothetical protein